jgi:hypothetical protein
MYNNIAHVMTMNALQHLHNVGKHFNIVRNISLIMQLGVILTQNIFAFEIDTILHISQQNYPLKLILNENDERK